MDGHSSSLAVRPLIIGAQGLVGRALAARFEDLYPHTVSATRTEIDITDRWRLEEELERLQPTVVINTAAVSDVDLCERDPLLAHRVNAEGAHHLARVCRLTGARLIHFSTDYVFGGDENAPGEYDEADPVAPVNEYGRSKAEGERAVLEELADCAVVRVSFVFGPGRETFLDRIAKAARTGTGPIPAVDGWRNKPTGVDAIVDALTALVPSDATGLWHVAGGPAVTRAEFARQVVALVGGDPARVVGIDDASLDLAARRPRTTPLATHRFEARFGFAPRPWLESARALLAARG